MLAGSADGGTDKTAGVSDRSNESGACRSQCRDLRQPRTTQMLIRWFCFCQWDRKALALLQDPPQIKDVVFKNVKGG
jgi:hypothetical protein